MKARRGFFMIEALLSIVIFTVLLLSIFSMISFLQRRTVRSDFESEAALLLEEGMEIANSAVLADWDGYADGDYHPVFDASEGNWILLGDAEDSLEARYSRKITLSKICRGSDGEIGKTTTCAVGDPLTRRIEVKVWWTEDTGEKTIQASLLVLNNNDQ